MKISENQLKELLIADDAPALELLSADGAKVNISAEMVLTVSKDFSSHSFERKGYKLSFGGEQNVKTAEEVVSKLKELNVLCGGEAELERVGGYKTVEEYTAAKDFDKIDMAGLIEKYRGIADSFVLVCPYNDGYDKDHPFGCVKLSEEDAKNAFDKIKVEQLKTARGQYDYLPKEEKASLPPFEKLLAEIQSEYDDYVKNHSAEIDKYNGYTFFADKFMRGETKYVKPGRLWHIYHVIDFIGSTKYALGKMQQNSVVRPVDFALRQKDNEALLKNLERTEVTFTWHCTTSSMLSTVFHIKLNDDTISWLMQFKDDYGVEKSGLEDLAFYKGDALLFSSCTHESFHSDCSENLKK